MKKKYTTLYKYVPRTYLNDILKNERLYLDDGKKFNDPFEIGVVDRKTNEINHLEGLHILSLTNSFQNKLMWSHYAENHMSVCLTIRVPNEYVYPICYTKHRVFDDTNIDEIIEKRKKFYKKSVEKEFSNLTREKKIALVKDQKWIYEKEYRLVFDVYDETNLIYDNDKWFIPVKITNVYLGVKFDKNDKVFITEILNICKEKNIKVTNMILSNENYSVVVKHKFNKKKGE